MRPGKLLDPAAQLRLEAACWKAERHNGGENRRRRRARRATSTRKRGLAPGCVARPALVFAGLLAFAPPLAGWIYLASQAAGTRRRTRRGASTRCGDCCSRSHWCSRA